MTNELHNFREALLQAVHTIRQGRPGALIHLLYTPELHDPLELVGETLREEGLIYPPAHLKTVSAGRDKSARLLTLDCRRVAGYLYESDECLDDPIFEQSITQSHAEIRLAQSHNAEVSNDERELSDHAIGGWVISTESAATLAARLRSFSTQQGVWGRWTNPFVLNLLWPTMSIGQRFAMIGEASWLAFDSNGVLRHYAAAADRAARDANVGESQSAPVGLDEHQIQLLNNVPLVRDLLSAWRSMLDEQGRVLPAGAEQVLYTHISRAQRSGLHAESVAIYAMTAVQLKGGATNDADWTRMVTLAAYDGLALRDLLETLPDPFWLSYGSPELNG